MEYRWWTIPIPSRSAPTAASRYNFTRAGTETSVSKTSSFAICRSARKCSTAMFNLDDIHSARQRIQGRVKRTPLVTSQALSERLGANVYLKLELFQKTSPFRVGGALNKVLNIPEDRRGRGLAAVSGGNHAQAVAYAASQLGLPSVILMPEKTPRNYVDATRSYGADVVLVASTHEAFQKICTYENDGWTTVHPFDDPLVMAGGE